MAELSNRFQSKKKYDEDHAWMKTMRSRSRTNWTQEDEDRALRIQREAKTETRQDTLYSQGQEKYEHGLQRRPKVEAQQDELSGLRRRGETLRIEDYERGPRPTMTTGYNTKTGKYERELIDPYTGKATPIESDLSPVQSRRLYDVTSAEVSAWKASNFDQSNGVPNEDFVPLDEWVLRMRAALGETSRGLRSRSQGRAPLSPRINIDSLDGGLRLMRGQNRGGGRKPAQKIAIPDLYEPIG
ncbi:MAG: hypothetical protein FVQ81_02055 [Candidatus Glassbacteria bacterium]|nr:hypothetical protein [Candidatus Glassbacteria bacterium]